jgi:ubiquinone/menaquinone biosynthesis C-methylase UbiE
MHNAFKVWDNAGEPLESVEARIHDGVPAEELRSRALGYINWMAKRLPKRLPPDSVVVEVGPGVGYIMEAFAERTAVSRVIGLDVAPQMVERARERIARDGQPADRFEFVLYDGTTFPWDADQVDVFYSVAAIQHIPKPYAYNVLFEMNRCLKPGGRAIVHLLSWELVKREEFSLVDEVRQQIAGAVSHWHHFYDAIELDTIASRAIKPASYKVVPDGISIWLVWTK